MDYDEARKVGDAAEARVAAELARLQPTYGFTVIHDVLVGKHTKSRSLTAQLDHVLIDQYGVLVFETKTRKNAVIMGTYADAKWTACYPGGRTEPFQNPLRQNEQHLNLLYQVLEEAGVELSLDHVRGLTVFVDTEISRLKLDSVTSQRVADFSQLSERIAARYDYVAQTPMSPSVTASLIQAIYRLDRSNDPGFLQAHAVSRQGGARRGAATTESAAVRSGFAAHQSPKSAPLVRAAVDQSGREAVHRRVTDPTPQRIVFAVIVLAAVGFVAWGALAFLRGTAPAWAWVGLFFFLAALGGAGGKPGRRKRSRRAANPPGASMSPGQYAVIAIALLGFAVLMLVGVPWAMRMSLERMSAGIAARGVSVTAASSSSVALAQQRLREADPTLYKALVQPDNPRVTKSGSLVTYQWDYLKKRGAAAVQVQTTSITLNAEGHIVGASN